MGMYLALGQPWALAGKGSIVFLANTLAGFGVQALIKGPAVYEFDLLSCNERFLSFLATHLPQLGLNNIPQSLWQRLHAKLSSQVFDAAEHFTYAVDEDAMCVVGGSGGIAKEADIFLLDHAITVKCARLLIDVIDVIDVVDGD